MADIHFSADMDASKLEAAIKESNKTVGEFVKGIEKGGGVIDKVFEHTSKSIKQAISEQKTLIKFIEQDVKRLQKVYDDTAAGQVKSSAGANVGQAKRALSEEQGKLNGLQKEQIKLNEQEGSTIGGIVSKIGAWAAGLVTVGAALKIAKSIIDSTEGSAHKFEVVVAEATAGVGYFFKSIASGDWSNFVDNIQNAIKGAKDYVDAMEVIANKQNEQKIKSSQLDKEIAALRDDTYDKDISNNSKRQESLIKIIDKEKIKFTEEAALAKSIYETNLKKAATDSGLSEKQIENFIKEYSSLEKMIAKGEEFNKLQKLMFSPGMSNKFYDELQKQINALGPGAKAAGKYAKQISKVVPETRAMLSGYMAAANQADAAFGSKNRRDKMQLAEVTNKIKDDAEAKAKAVLEIKNEIERLKAESIDIGSTATDKGIKKELLLISNKYKEDLLKYKDNEEAKLLLEERYVIERLNILKKYNSEIAKSAKELDPGKGYSILNRAVNRELTPGAIGGTNKTLSGNKMNQLRELSKEVIAKNKQDGKEIVKDTGEELKLRMKIVNAAADLVMQLGQSVGLSQEEMQLLGGTLDAFTKMATGDLPGAAISMVSGLMAMIPNEAEKFALQMEHLNNLISQQQRLIEQSNRIGGKVPAIKDQMELLKQQSEVNKEQVRIAEITVKDKQGFMFGIGIGVNGAKKKLEEAKQAAIETQNAINDLQQEFDDFMRGGMTENTIADTIAQGFQDGKTSVDDFGNYMNQVLIDAVMNIFKANILDSPLMKEYIDTATQSLSDNVLTDVEKKNLTKLGKEFSDTMKPTWEGLTSALDMGGNAANAGLSGGIQRQITEDTASELTGLFRRYADEQRVVKDYSILGVAHLVGIEANTMNTVLELQKANIKLDTVITNTKQVPVGAL